MLNQTAFTQGMNKLGELWPVILGKARLPRYYKAVQNLSTKEFEILVEEFLDGSTFAPVPKNFLEAVARMNRAKEVWVDKFADIEDDRSREKLQGILGQYGASNVIEAMDKFRKQRNAP